MFSNSEIALTIELKQPFEMSLPKLSLPIWRFIINIQLNLQQLSGLLLRLTAAQLEADAH